MMILDGAMGTMLMAQGFKPADQPLVLVNITQPETIIKIHQAYIAAGSQGILTHSFGAGRLNLKSLGLEGRFLEINERAALNAREAAGSRAKIFASIALPSPGDSEARLKDMAWQMTLLLKHNVDGVVFETITSLADVELAVRALADVDQSLTRVVSISPRDDGTLNDGTALLEAAYLVLRAGLDYLGLNCLTGPKAAAQLATEMAAELDAKLIIKPNAGLPQTQDGQLIHPIGPEEFANELKPVFALAAMIGGCCGTTPAHIKQLALATS